MKLKKILGIDIGGSGVKGAVVNTKKGKLVTDRFRIPTPKPAKPEAVADVIRQITEHFQWKGPVGVGFPGVIQRGIARTAANVDDSWIDQDVNKLFSEKTGCKVHVVNDADAAGMAEVKFGAGKGETGVVFLITVGTGLGTVLFVNGKPVPNLELGHLLRIEELVWPDKIIIGGGASKKGEKFFPYLTTKAPVVPARLMNEAGIVGAALVSRYYNKLEKKEEKKKKK